MIMPTCPPKLTPTIRAMNKYLLITIISLFATLFAHAAPEPKEGDEKWTKELQDFKLKYLAQEMKLKDDQKQRFVEVYSRLDNERAKLLKEEHDMRKRVEAKANPTDNELNAAIAKMSQSKIDEARLEQKYDAQFKAFLTPRQIFTMKKAEFKFKRKLFEMRHKDGQRHKQRKGNQKKQTK